MKKIAAAFLTLLTGAFIACSSANYPQLIKEPERKYFSGDPSGAARHFLPLINEKGKDQLLFLMEAGLMLHTAEEYDKSAEVFLAAAQITDNAATSVTRQAASLFINETSTNYKGEDFERVLVHMYLGINFLIMKNSESARVEFKKVNDELARIGKESGRQYKQNIMAKYLTAIAYELTGDIENDDSAWDYAYVEYKQILALSPGLVPVHRDLQRMAKKLRYNDDYAGWTRRFGKKDNISADSGELIVIYQAGRGAVKQSRGNLMSDANMSKAINIALRTKNLQAGVTIAAVAAALRKAENPIPKFVRRSNQVRSIRLTDGNGRVLGNTLLLEDIETTAVNNLRDDYNRLYGKVAAGVVAKAAASVAAGMAAKAIAQSTDNDYLKAFSGLIGAAAGAGTAAALISQIKPDLRCWHTLPANLQLERIFLPPGKHTLTLNFIGNNGNVIRTETENVEIKKGEKTFVNYRTLF